MPQVVGDKAAAPPVAADGAAVPWDPEAGM